jgi:hypothetical protein
MLERVTLQYTYNILPTTNYAFYVFLDVIDVASVEKCHPNKTARHFQVPFATFYVSSIHSTLIVISYIDCYLRNERLFQGRLLLWMPWIYRIYQSWTTYAADVDQVADVTSHFHCSV